MGVVCSVVLYVTCCRQTSQSSEPTCLEMFTANPRVYVSNGTDRNEVHLPSQRSLCIQQCNSYSPSSLVYVYSQCNVFQLSHQEAWHMLLPALYSVTTFLHTSPSINSRAHVRDCARMYLVAKAC